MHKNAKGLILFFILILICSTLPTYKAEDPPFPGFPHEFWGTVKNQNGEGIPDGAIIKAIVGNESYYTTVMFGLYGYNETYQNSTPPFLIEDPYNHNTGKTIYFYVGGIDTTQIAIFEGGVNTNLDLTIDDGSGTANGGSPPSNGQPPQPKINPIADADGPYFISINRSVILDGSNSSDSDGTIVSYEWDFGDGSTSEGISPDHNYSAIGNYTVFLIVTDNDGLKDNDTTIVYVYDDTDGDGWTDEEEARYKTDPDDPNDYPVDTDGDYIPDVIDFDDDNDGLNDTEENTLGSNPIDKNDVKIVVYQGVTFFFVDTDADGQPNIYYNKNSGFSSVIGKSDEVGIYFVNTDNDNTTWEYIYNYQENTLTPYSEIQGKCVSEYPDYIGYIIVIIIVMLVLIIVVYFKKIGGKKE